MLILRLWVQISEHLIVCGTTEIVWFIFHSSYMRLYFTLTKSVEIQQKTKNCFYVTSWCSHLLPIFPFLVSFSVLSSWPTWRNEMTKEGQNIGSLVIPLPLFTTLPLYTTFFLANSGFHRKHGHLGCQHPIYSVVDLTCLACTDLYGHIFVSLKSQTYHRGLSTILCPWRHHQHFMRMRWQDTEGTMLFVNPLIACWLHCPTGLHLWNTSSEIPWLRILTLTKPGTHLSVGPHGTA